MILSGRATARLRKALRELGGSWYATDRRRASVPGSVIHDLAHWQDFGWPLHEAPGGRDIGMRVGEHLMEMYRVDRLQAEFRACAVALASQHDLLGTSTDPPAQWGDVLHEAFGIVEPHEAVRDIRAAGDLTSVRLATEALTAHLRRMAAP